MIATFRIFLQSASGVVMSVGVDEGATAEIFERGKPNHFLPLGTSERLHGCKNIRTQRSDGIVWGP